MNINHNTKLGGQIGGSAIMNNSTAYLRDIDEIAEMSEEQDES
jgi:hypothetical protein